MSAAYSRGPWHVGVGGNLHANRVWTEDMQPVAALCSFGSAPADLDPTAQANGRLIAAAPRLVDACCGLLGLLQLITDRPDVSDELREVMATNHRVIEASMSVAEATGEASAETAVAKAKRGAS